MKLYNKIALIFAFGVVLTSCSQWIDPEVNIDPDANTSASVSSILPNVQVNAAYVFGGADFAALTGIWNQHITGADRQFLAFQTYNVQSNNFDNAWSTIYASVLMDAKIVSDNALSADNPSPHYSGVAKVITAYGLGTMTSVWGDLPYSAALTLGEGGFKPAYDTQEAIYTSIVTLLDEAITELGNSENAIPLSDGDMIYGGDTDAWTKAAYALKARYALHLMEKGGASSAVTAALDNAFDSNDDNFSFVFGTSEDLANPLYQFRDQRAAYVATSDAYISVLGDDPRASVQTDQEFGSAYSNIDSPVLFISYPELLFIKAEISLDAADYNDAVKASLEYYGVFDQAWYDANSKASVTLQDVMEAKYVHMFMNPESFMDVRRTGFPVLTPTINDKLPRRFFYPSDEKNYNAENVPDIANVFQNIWLLQ